MKTPGLGPVTRTADVGGVLAGEDMRLLKGIPVVIDGAEARDGRGAELYTLLPGGIYGQISATGKYGATIIGKTLGAYTTGTVLSCTTACAAEISRRVGSSGTLKIAGAASGAGTIHQESVSYTAVDLDTGQLTISALTNDYHAGSIIQPADGSEVPLVVMGDEPMLAVDPSDFTTDQDVPMKRPLVGGLLRVAQLLHYPASTATSLITWLKAQMRAAGQTFMFDDDFL